MVLCLVTLPPYITGMSGLPYLCVALVLNARILWHAIVLKLSRREDRPMRVFRFSVTDLLT